MADKYYFCASAGKDVVITKNVIKTGGTVSMGILGKIATSACSNQFDCPHSEKCDQTGGSREFHPKLCVKWEVKKAALFESSFLYFPCFFFMRRSMCCNPHRHSQEAAPRSSEPSANCFFFMSISSCVAFT